MAISAASTGLANPPSPSSNRFLFIVDTSSTMKKLDEPLRDAIFDLLYSGVRAYMTNGDSYGVWLAADTNNTSSSVEVWRHKFATELASRTALRIKDAGCKGKPALNAAIADATRVARAVGDLTVILVSNGETPLHGTPFDAELNAAIEEVKPAMKAAKATINTTLVARNGKFIGWAVNSPEFLVGMPAVPPPAAAAPAVASNTPPPAAAKAPAPTPAAPPKPAAPPARIASKPIVITRDTVDREKEATRALASILDAPVPIVATAAPAATATAAVAVTPVPPPPMPTPPPVEPVAPAAPSVPVVASNTANTVAPPAPPPAEAQIAAPETPKRAVSVPPERAKPATETGSNNWVWWIGGGAVSVAVAAALVFLFRRNRSPGQSLVSEAMALERLYKPRS